MRTTKSFKKYYRLYGPHFTKDLCNFAVSMMENESGPITPFTKQEIEDKLKAYNITLQYNKLYDFVYVANMCKADFLGTAVPNDDQHLCEYIKKVVDDPDGYDG
jgi:hypothetical protein